MLSVIVLKMRNRLRGAIRGPFRAGTFVDGYGPFSS